MSMFLIRPNFLRLFMSWKTDKDLSTRSKVTINIYLTVVRQTSNGTL